jgi:hypothetical protein
MLTRTRSCRHSPWVGLCLLLACSADPPTGGNESITSSGSAEVSTADPGTGGPNTSGPTTSGSSAADSETSTGADASTGGPGSTGQAMSDTSTTGGVGETTGGGSTSGSTGSSTGGSSGEGDSSTGAGDGLVLDPDTLVVFELPINSLRYAVSGFDADHATCVSIIFTYPGDEQHCDDFMVGDDLGFPYVFVTPDAAPPCMDWDYQGNVQLDAASGCMQLTDPAPPAITIDMTLEVSGAPFTGTISVASK